MEENEAQIASLQYLKGNWDDVSKSDLSDLENDEEFFVEDSSIVPKTINGERIIDGDKEDWFEEEALPLGRCFGVKQAKDERIKTLLRYLNLNFGSNGMADKRVVVPQGSQDEGVSLSIMNPKFICWNMRGSNSVDKLYMVRRLVRKHRSWFVGIQETRRATINSQ